MNLEQRIGKLDFRVDNLDQKVDKLDQRVDKLDHDVQDLRIDVTQMKTQIPFLATKEEVVKSRNVIIYWLISLFIATGVYNHFAPLHLSPACSTTTQETR